MDWMELKNSNLKKLQQEIEKGKVDNDIIELLNVVNSRSEYQTLSSCSGRMVLLDIPGFGDKKNANFIYKSHETKNDYKNLLKYVKMCENECWLLVQPPILHIACKKLEDAEFLMNLAVQSGFRETGIISLKRNIVRIHSSERIETIIGKNGRLLIDEDYFKELVEIGNKKLKKSKDKLKKLLDKFLSL